ncbi:hypothetical protein IV203_005022 [Nitzschia inconspicua]|uniref:Uncharacterized protein n=1 Tax=Nitzschia inconspicua TaxID=303405 RepID=A0A9K3PG28_9STRA|nr:hypothetical protein IV203_005022 [Nitzschia inconspicua]
MSHQLTVSSIWTSFKVAVKPGNGNGIMTHPRRASVKVTHSQSPSSLHNSQSKDDRALPLASRTNIGAWSTIYNARGDNEQGRTIRDHTTLNARRAIYKELENGPKFVA